mmetsp:Transcript_28561/g.34776  ORF Transcript_28561/g.34776 Transcript_28561/m.34776 type:complete len:302 (+) Transcript_28561:203-1108(+)|eukprot:CAMPEP_0172502360 /NCGR_PEP_ID=MMETSP1066-20121228/159131_1 /TAXON_ID=671091 /ORGANISM="Coscinodiscus wailesii, Strain CCMP2513" /LENGTH=301 /DNA_ID=CAMNT_0013277581 /DNA_START=190 /DNA_END=1095 /DNA_ORIENTATION=+
MNENDKKQANLRVLQRLDASVQDIVCSATHVVLYEFNQKKQHWEKRNVEGSLFITQRIDEPIFRLLVLNRNSTDNLEVSIGIHFQMQVREPYLIFRSQNGDATIRGLWFHDNNERRTVSTYLEQIVEDAKNPAAAAISSPTPTTVASPPTATTSPALNQQQQQQYNPGAFKRDATTATTPSLAQMEAMAPSTPQKTPLPAAAVTSEDVNIVESLLSPLSLATQQPSSERQTSPTPPPSSSSPNDAASAAATSPLRNVVLDKKSLQLSLLALIQDEKFLDLIHAQYLKVAHTRVNKRSGRKS